MEQPPLIVNAALTGMVPTRRDSPHVPLTPAEIAADAARCREAGAAIVHLHARDAEGRPTSDPLVYGEIVRAVRAAAPDLIVCVSCSGRREPEIDRRAAVLDLDGDAKPDLASLTLGSMNFAREASVNEPGVIAELASRMRARGIRPELEAFEAGMVEVARYLLRKGVLEAPLYFNLLFGSRGTASLTPLNLGALVAALPAGATWAAAGIGRFQTRAAMMAIAAGGHVRTGLEDNLWWDGARTRLATNAELVARVVELGRAAGRAPATPDEARALLGW